MTCNRNRGRPVPRRQHIVVARGPVDRDHRVGCDSSAGTNGAMRWPRAGRRPIAAEAVSDVRSVIPAHAPPRLASAHPWSPAPAESVVIVPCAALERHITPRIAGGPDVAKARRVSPIPVPIGIPARICGFVRRPDIALAGHVIPVAVCVQIVPCWIAVCLPCWLRRRSGCAASEVSTWSRSEFQHPRSPALWIRTTCSRWRPSHSKPRSRRHADRR